jgi:Zn ribbon nucleic-acid-binding protein
MNFVRCEQCGAKALIAASQCPKCTHPLSLRDFRGDVVPLAHCHKCDTYYRRSLGGCRWCGTKATGVALPRRVIVAGAVVVLAVAAVGSWQWRAAKGRAAAAALADSMGATELASTAAGEVAVPTPALPGPTATPLTSPDSGAADSAAEPGEEPDTADALPARATPPAAGAAGTSATAAPTGASPPPSALRAPAGVASPGAAPGSGPGGAQSKPPRTAPRYAGPWSSGMAREWVNVRASNSPASEVVGVVTPNTRVQLGELRAGWRRVRSAGVEGWADARYFTSDSTAR